MKDIVIIANFCRDFSETDNGRFLYLCKELSREHRVEIITSDFGHDAKRHKEPLVHSWPFTVTFLHEPGYKKNISLQRFVSHRAWGGEVKKYLESRKRPDVIYCAVPSLTAPLEAAKYCEKNNIRFVIDVQDLWPEAFKLVFHVPVLNDIVFAPFNRMANGIYSRADSICGVSQTYVDRALEANKKCANGHVVFLGTKLSAFDGNAEKNQVVKPEGELWIGYCGTLGASYDILTVMEALHLVSQHGMKPPKFVVMGDGERRREFEARAKELGVDCLFTGALAYDKMCGMLAACDIAANPIMRHAAQSIINKHGDYASAGIPVINTQECQEYRDLVENYRMGFNVRNGDAKEFAEKITVLMQDAALRRTMGENSRKCAEERFDRARTYQGLIDAILAGDEQNTHGNEIES